MGKEGADVGKEGPLGCKVPCSTSIKNPSAIAEFVGVGAGTGDIWPSASSMGSKEGEKSLTGLGSRGVGGKGDWAVSRQDDIEARGRVVSGVVRAVGGAAKSTSQCRAQGDSHRSHSHSCLQ